MNGGDGEANNYSSGAPVSSGAIEQWREEIEEERERMRRERGLPRRGNSEPPRPVPLEVVYEFAHEAARAAEAAIDAAAASVRAARRAAVAAELVADAMTRGVMGTPDPLAELERVRVLKPAPRRPLRGNSSPSARR